jgi:hypothetical protein
MPAKLSVGLIGLGPWGQNYIRTIGEMDRMKLKIATGKLGDDRVVSLACNHMLDAVILAASPEANPNLALALIGYGCPIMVEKPVALKAGFVRQLASYADARRVPVLVNHTPLFDPNYEEFRRYADRAHIRWIGSKRHAFSPIFDYGAHAMAIAVDMGGDVDVGSAKRTAWGEICEVPISFGKHKMSARFGFGQDADDRGAELGPMNYRPSVAHAGPDAPLRRALDVFEGLVRGGRDPRAGFGLPLRVTELLEEIESQLNEQIQAKTSHL